MANKNTLRKRKTTSKSLPNDRGIVSCNPRLNLCQKVLRNQGGQSNGSLTVHEALDPKQPILARNHKYVEYRHVTK